VLVQWSGLSPDDTSWESWKDLCQNYHLEDKVTLQAPRDDTNVQTIEEAVNRIAKQGVQEEKKPKRKITKPTYLNDYV